MAFYSTALLFLASVLFVHGQVWSSSTGMSESSSSTGGSGDESSSSTGGPAPPSPGPGGVVVDLMAGFQKTDNKSTLLIDHGVATPNQRYFTDTEYYTVVYFWLLPTAPENITFTAEIDTKLPGIKYGTKNMPVHPGANQMTELFIRYTGCPENITVNRFPIHATIKITGYNDILLNWQKECDPSNKPYIPPQDGMGPTATFFLVVFILGVLFCVAGCGYNFISRGRSGYEVIPCWSYIERYLCCKGEKRYSPSMDYNQPIGDDDSYGASYQADL